MLRHCSTSNVNKLIYNLLKIKKFIFLMLFFLFFKLIPDFFVKEDEDGKIRHDCIKIHVAIAITATTTLLNLNLNYEKLRRKDSKFYLLTNVYDTNFCIF